MTTEIDWAAIKAATPAIAARLFGELPRDRKVRCPFHDDGTASLHIYDDGFHCFGCGAKGDAADLVAQLQGVTASEAVSVVLGAPVKMAPRVADDDPWLEVGDVPGPPPGHRLGEPSAAYRYPSGYVLRWDGPEGKTLRPVVWCRHRDTGELAWRWRGFRDPRPLYLAERVKGEVAVIVEGEKAADHLRACRVEAITWPGGSKAWQKAAWNTVPTRRVILWPDNDEPGRAAMDGIAALLLAQGLEVRVVDVSGLPEKGDAADLTPDQCIALLRASRPVGAPASPETSPNTSSQPEASGNASWPFRCLGQRENAYYFLESRGQSVVRLTASGMSKAALLDLAPLDWWIGQFPAGKAGWDGEAAANAVISESKRSIYSDERQRGRGIWLDAGRVVYHAGDAALVDGVETRLTGIDSRYAYPIAPALARPAVPLKDAEASELLDTIALPSWRSDAHGRVVAGWVMCSLLAGVMPWRPSIWIQGAAGTGKTSILRDYIARLLGPFAQLAMGNSTEAGIRQRVGCDARPIVIDEAEPGSESDARRLASILQLMRQASSDSDALTLRGTATGSAMAYHMRSPFCFGAIQSSLHHGADRDRVTLVALRSAKAGELTQAEAAATYQAWQDALRSWPVDIHERLLARALALAPIAREVAGTMGAALLDGRHVVSQREADQIGALMAGAWLMQSSTVPTPAEASAWVGCHDWTDVTDAAADTDAERARDALLAMITIGDGDRASVLDRITTIGRTTGDVAARHQQVLAWYGLRALEDGRLFVATVSENRKTALQATPYAGDLTGLLRQLAGTDKANIRVAGKMARGVIVTLPE